MAVIGTRSFKGEIPRVEPHLLPPENAQRAIDCHFASGALRSMRGNPSPIPTSLPLASPTKGLYTVDGIGFYSWPAETQTFKGPVIADSYLRLYYLQPSVGEFRVATEHGIGSKSTPDGVKAGVPRPTVAPVLSLLNRTTIPGYEGKTIVVTGEAWLEDTNGKEHSRASASFTMSTLFRRYTFSAPSEPTGGEEGMTYKVCAKVSFKEAATNTEIFGGTVKGTATARSAALPGGIEFSLEQTAGSSTVALVLNWGVAETRAYVYTVTNNWDEESAPSPAEIISVTYIQDVSVGVTVPDFAGYFGHKTVRLYRTFGSNTAYIEADYEAGAVLGTVVDRKWKPKSGGKALESNDWTPPPIALGGAALMPNGWFAAFQNNTLYMSEPYRPHAWPYSMAFSKSIRGIKVAQQSLVVTTADGVYVVAGSHPKAAQQIKLSTPQAGIAQRCMAQVDGAVAYLSNDGFVMVEGTTASPSISQQLFDRRTWRERYASQLLTGDTALEYFDGALIGLPMSATPDPKGFLIRMDDGGGSFTQLSLRADAMYQLPVNDALYYTVSGRLYQFGTGTDIQFDWWSRDYVLATPDTFGAGFARFSGPLTMTLYADGSPVHTMSITQTHFRLPTLNRALRWSFRLTGTGVVHEFLLGRSMAELKTT